MDQKIAIVTGGASGIGLATARKLACHHIHTIIIGRDQQKLDEAIKSIGKNCEAISFDLNNTAYIPDLIQQIVKKHKRIDILVNNAGINLKKQALEVSTEEFQQIIHINLTSVFVITREVARVMVKNKHGSIINISSMAAQYGLPGVVAYSASKSAIEGMTRALATELSPLGIRINCIAPGFILTSMSAAAFNGDPERKKKVLARTPMGKLGDPQDIANAIYFLASDQASFVTGTVIPVDGGNSIGF